MIEQDLIRPVNARSDSHNLSFFIKSCCYYFTLFSTNEVANLVLVSAAIDLSSFSREEIPIPVGLELNSDSWLPTLQKDSGVSMLSVQDLHNPDGCKVLVALGTDQQCHLASILSNRTFQHLQSLHRMRTHSTSLKQKIHVQKC